MKVTLKVGLVCQHAITSTALRRYDFDRLDLDQLVLLHREIEAQQRRVERPRDLVWRTEGGDEGVRLPLGCRKRSILDVGAHRQLWLGRPRPNRRGVDERDRHSGVG
jgi:hypothetical protein